MNRAALLTATLLLSSGAARAQTLQGNLPGDETWSGTVDLLGDVTVPAGRTLTILPGTQVTFPAGDSMASGASTTRTELIIGGGLLVQGTSAQPVTFHSRTSATAGAWHSIQVLAAGTASLAHAIIEHATTALDAEAGVTLQHLTVRNNLSGVKLNAGNSSLVDSLFTGTRYPLEVNGGTATVQRNLFHGNCVGTGSTSGYAAGFFSGALGSVFEHNTVAANPSCYFGVYGSNVSVTNNVVASNGYYGLYRTATSMTASHNLVWGHTTNFYTTALQGLGTVVANPLFVGATNFRLTSRSPGRKADSSGGDVGALPYVSDATGPLMGTLFTNTTFQTGQTYVLDGDLTVAPGVTLTVQPGAIVRAKTADGMGAGQSTSKVELIVHGSLQVLDGTPLSQFRSDAATPAAGNWRGISFAAGSTGAVRAAMLQHAEVALETEVSLTLEKLAVSQNLSGVQLNAGTSSLVDSVFTGTRYPLEVNGGAATVQRNLFHGNCAGTGSTSGYAAGFISGAAGSVFDHNTVADNPSCYFGVYGSNVTVTNNVVASNGYYGLYRTATSMVADHNLVWGHTTNFYTTALNGAGTQVTNPLFVGGTDYRITSRSPARFADSSGGDLGALPFAGDLTALWMGTLFTNTTFVAGQTYVLDGDLTVAPGVTLTVQPGAIVRAKTTDGMGGGQVTSKTELIVRGTLDVQQGAPKAVFRSDSGSPAAGHWRGIYLATGSTGTLRTAVLQHAEVAVEADAALLADKVEVNTNLTGLQLNLGASTVTASVFTGNRYPLEVNGGTATVERNLFTANCVGTGSTSGYAAGFFSGNPGSVFDHNTVAENPSCYFGVYGSNVNATNNIVASNGYYGMYRTATSMTASYNLVWGHTTNFYTTALNGTGSLSTNPLFIGGGDFRLQASSPARGADSLGGDMGAFPYAPGAVAQVVVSPGTQNVAAGGMATFTAQAYDSVGQPVPGQSYVWSAAAAAGTITQGGVLTAACTPGTHAAAVTAAVGSITGTAQLTITAGALATLAVSPANYSLEVGQSHGFTASGKDACNNTVPVTPAWSALAAAGAITAGGQFTGGCTPGSYVGAVTATQGGISGSAHVTLTTGSLQSLVVSPKNATLGGGGTQQFSAVGADGCGNPVSAQPSWSVTAGGGTITSGGLFTASGAAGTYADTVRAQVGGVSDTATVNITGGALASITLSPSTGTYQPGAQQTFTAVGKDAAGNPVAISPTWTTTGGGAIHPQSGAWTAGTVAGSFPASVKASQAGVSGTASVTISAGPVTQVAVSPGSIEIGPGGSTQFTATARDVHGNATGAAITWSAHPSAGDITAAGAFTAGQGVGTYVNAITATADGVSGFATVTVKQGALTALVISPKVATVPVGSAVSFTAEGRDGAGQVVPVNASWQVLEGGGTITSGGVFVAGQQAGSFADTVEVSANGLTARATVNVTAGPAARITVLPEDPELVPGQHLNFAAQAEDAFGNAVSGPQFGWSALPAAGSITMDGSFVAGESPGVYPGAVTASLQGASGSTRVTITGEPVDGGAGTCVCQEGEVCRAGACVPSSNGEAPPSGCGCAAGPGVASLFWLLLALPLAARRRRARQG